MVGADSNAVIRFSRLPVFDLEGIALVAHEPLLQVAVVLGSAASATLALVGLNRGDKVTLALMATRRGHVDHGVLRAATCPHLLNQGQGVHTRLAGASVIVTGAAIANHVSV